MSHFCVVHYIKPEAGERFHSSCVDTLAGNVPAVEGHHLYHESMMPFRSKLHGHLGSQELVYPRSVPRSEVPLGTLRWSGLEASASRGPCDFARHHFRHPLRVLKRILGG